MALRLYIQDTLIPIISNIRLNKDFINQRQLNERIGDFSYTVRIPKTKVTNIVFENAHLINTIDKFVRQEEYISRVESNGNSSLDGLFRLTDIKEEYYEGVLVGNASAWAKMITGNLNELTNFDGTPWEFPFIGASGSTVPYSFAWHVANDNYSNSDVCFPLIPRGNFFHSANTTTNLIFDDGLFFDSIPPAVYHDKVVKKIFEGINWSVDGTTFNDAEHQKLVLPFTTNDIYKWNCKTLYEAHSSGGTGIIAFSPGGLIGMYDSFSKDFNQSNGHNATFYYMNPSGLTYNPFNKIEQFSFTNVDVLPANAQQYDISATGDIDIHLGINYFSGGTSLLGTGIRILDYGTNPYYTNNLIRGGFVLYFYEDDIGEQGMFEDIADYLWSNNPSASITSDLVIFYYDEYQSAYFGTPTSFQPADETANIFVNSTTKIQQTFFGPTSVNYEIKSGTTDVYITGLRVGATEKLRWAYVHPNRNSIPSVPSPNKVDSSFASFNTINWDFTAASGYTTSGVDISSNLPTVSQMEFLRSWIAMNNLFISFNQETKCVRFDSFDDFFLPNDFAYDITDKVDINYGEPEISPMNISKNIFFKYLNDSSDALLINDKDYANLQVTSDNIYALTDQTISCIYSATKTRDFIYTNNIYSGLTVALPMIAKQSDIDNVDLTTVQWTFSTSPRILKTDGYLTDTTGGTVSVSIDGFPTQVLLSRFEDMRSQDRLNLRWDTDNGLYERYYGRFLDSIGDSHILNLNSRINSYDYNRLQPQVPVKILDQNYILNKVDGFDPDDDNRNGTTKIELFKKFTN